MDLPFRKYAFLIVISILLVATLACLSSGNGGNDTGTSDESSDLEATAAALEATQKALDNEANEEPAQDTEQETAPSDTPESQGEIESSVGSEGDTSAGEEPDWNTLKSGDMVYVTQFNQGLDGWWWDVVLGGKNWVVDGGDDYLHFEIDETKTQVIAVYDNVYVPRGQGIIVESAFDNVGSVRNNNIILMCHITEDGWYEFIMTSSGLWYITKFDASDGKWTNLAQGGLPNYDKHVTDHVLTALCDSNGDLGLAYDYKELKNGFINDKSFKEGFTGLAVYAANIPGVEVEFDWFQLEIP